MMKNIFIVFLLVVAWPTFALLQTPTPTIDLWTVYKGPVKTDPRIVGKAFTFRGRAGYRNGNVTSLKIWIIGTHRLLGVLSDGCIPDNLAVILRNDLNAQVYGIFTVYPFTPHQDGVMQFVCIDSVKITKVVKGQ